MKVVLKEDYKELLGSYQIINDELTTKVENYYTVLEKDKFYELRDCNKVREYEHGVYTVLSEIVNGEFTVDYTYNMNGQLYRNNFQFYSKEEWKIKKLRMM